MIYAKRKTDEWFIVGLSNRQWDFGTNCSDSTGANLFRSMQAQCNSHPIPTHKGERKMAKRISMAIVMAFLVAAMSISAVAAAGSGSGNGGFDPDGLPTWSG